MTPHEYGLWFWVFGKEHYKAPKIELSHIWRAYYNNKEICLVHFRKDQPPYYVLVMDGHCDKDLTANSSEEILQKIDEYVRSLLNDKPG